MNTERDKSLAQQVVARFIGDGQSVPPGVLPLTLRDAIADALATTRREAEEATLSRLKDRVTIRSGNSELNEAYFQVRFLGRTIWSGGGPRESASIDAEDAAAKFCKALESAARKVEEGK